MYIFKNIVNMSSEEDTNLSQHQKQQEEEKEQVQQRNLSVQRWSKVSSLQTNMNTDTSLEQQQIHQTNGKILVYFNDFLSKKQNTLMYPPEKQYNFV